MTRVIKIGKKVLGKQPDEIAELEKDIENGTIKLSKKEENSVTRHEARVESIGARSFRDSGEIPSIPPNDITHWYEILRNGDIHVSSGSNPLDYYISNTYTTWQDDTQFIETIRRALDERR